VAAAFAAGASGVALIKFGAVVVPQAIDWAVGLAGVSAIAIALAGLAAVSAGARARTVLGVAAVAQLSWVAAAVSAHDREGTAAAVLLLAPVVLALAAAPVLLGVLELGGSLEPSGLAQRSPGRAAGLALAGLSLAGVPPLGGFVGQALAALAVLRTGYGAALGLALAGSLLCWLGVFRLLQAAYAGGEAEEARGRRAPVPAALTAASGGALLAGALLLAYTVFANPISGLAYQSAEALGLR
jgi:NADH:ubiquinone oxidoreductase subunit 2 (subunit N)